MKTAEHIFNSIYSTFSGAPVLFVFDCAKNENEKKIILISNGILIIQINVKNKPKINK